MNTTGWVFFSKRTTNWHGSSEEHYPDGEDGPYSPTAPVGMPSYFRMSVLNSKLYVTGYETHARTFYDLIGQPRRQFYIKSSSLEACWVLVVGKEKSTLGLMDQSLDQLPIWYLETTIALMMALAGTYIRAEPLIRLMGSLTHTVHKTITRLLQT